MKRNIQVGEKISINDIEGTVTDITNTTLILETKQGTVVIPAKLTNDHVCYKV
ncbi:MAG: mechanosensitive ion channel domain-containing protein [Candidatus Berkiella sp.]